MKVILLRDVAKIGRRFQTVSVASGYARNKLIPAGDAVAATQTHQRHIAAHLKESEQRLKEDAKRLSAVTLALSKTTVPFSVRANEKGHLFEGVSREKVAAHLSKQGHAIPAEALSGAFPIKETGEYPIEIASGESTTHFVLAVHKQQ